MNPRTLFVTLLLRFAVEFPKVSSSDKSVCSSNSSLPADLKAWPLNPSGDNVVVLWNFDRVCADVAHCYGNSSSPTITTITSPPPVNFVTVNQLPPVQIRPDQTISFSVGKQQSSSVRLQYYRVDVDGFMNCVPDDSKRLIITDDTRIGVTSGGGEGGVTLTLGNNYFIANDVSGSAGYQWQCFPYGLRLNVTVQPRNCSQWEPNTGQLCTNRGDCAVRMYEPYYSCRCCPGYIGDYCEQMDGCYDKNCHQGTCIDQSPDDGIGPGFQCSCDPGFTGVFCETVSGPLCPSNECSNRGVCILLSADEAAAAAPAGGGGGGGLNYRCYCPLGFTGKVCETNINECFSGPCANGAQCQDEVNKYSCNCTADFGGLNCETYIGVCPPDRCLNGGTCNSRAKDDDTRCQCTSTYTGLNCETKIEICHANFCANAIDCIEYGQNFKCICNPGYTGQLCDVDVDECASNPCLNGGTCHDHVAAFSCDCPDHLLQPVCDPPEGISKDTKDTKAEATNGLAIALGVIGALLFIALIILLIYCCAVHKPYKKLRMHKKYAHIVDEGNLSSKGSIRSASSNFSLSYGSGRVNRGLDSEAEDIALGAHPSPDFQSEASSSSSLSAPPDAEVISQHSAKSPLVRRVKHTEQSRV